MALQVWIPFINGNANNQGISNVKINGTATYGTGGKIGQKYLNSSSEIYVDVPEITDTKTCTFAFWAYIVSASVTTAWTGVAYFNDKGVNAGSTMRFEVCPKTYANGIYCFSNHNNVNYGLTTGCITSPANGYYDQWVHFCFTSDGTTFKRYMNGKLIGECKYDGKAMLGGRFGLKNNHLCYKQDVRIYDNCLSAREVKELSKGMVCHYPLNQPEHEVNLVNDSLIHQTAATYGFAGRKVSLEANKTYTLFANGHVDDGNGEFRVFIYNSNWSKNSSVGTKSKTNTTIRCTIKPTTSESYTITSYSYLTQGTVGGNVTLNWYKLVEGDVSNTTWSPNSSDTINWNDNREYDTSGNVNHGTINSSVAPIVKLNSPRYNNCYYFENKHYISGNTIFGASAVQVPVVTINFWVNQVSGGNYSTIFSWNGYSGKGVWLGVNVESSGQWSYIGGNSPNYCRGGNVSKNTWNMFTYVFDNGEAYWYLNGQRAGSNVTYSSYKYLELNGGFIIGDNYTGKNWDTNFAGYMSDFRIYATALSDADILELYNTPVSLTNTGTIMTQGEFIES